MRRRATLLQRMHIDGPLLILLLTLAAGSLFVLYSASGKNWDLLIKQASSFGLGLLSMVVIAQLEPRFMARWVPLGLRRRCIAAGGGGRDGPQRHGRHPLDQHSGGDSLPAVGIHEDPDAGHHCLVPVQAHLAAAA